MKNLHLQFDAAEIRDALSRIEETSQESLAPPSRNTLYIPQGHTKALSLSSSVVVGMRGSGKSYWTAVLNSPVHRDYVAATAGIPDLQHTDVTIGFALDPSNPDFPDTERLSQLRGQGYSGTDVWQTVVLVHALRAAGKKPLSQQSWEEKVKWLAKDREAAGLLLGECDRRLADQGRHLLVLFDALDRIGTTWAEVRHYLKGLLQLSLQSRSRRAIRMKVFLRPDMEEDEEVWNFVDSSKLRASRVELTWRPADLFALVLLYLANSDAGPNFRKEITRRTTIPWSASVGIYQLPRKLAVEQPARAIIEAITGEWVGTSAKRGYVYTWVPTHLADAKGRLSPRSFLLAFRESADWTAQNEPSTERALHFRGIQQGVAKASEIRVAEISEDYPWVTPLLEAARGLTVPCNVEDLTSRWNIQKMEKFRAAVSSKLPPRRFGGSGDLVFRRGANALVEDLVELAILYRTEDERLNIPDIFRVGFGIRRLGGVRPPR